MNWKQNFDEELSSITPEEIEESASVFGNFYFGVTAEQLEELKAGRVLYSRDEYGIFFALVDEHPAEVKRRKEEQRAAELEELKSRVKPGGFVWFKPAADFPARKLKVTAVSDTQITAGFMIFSIQKLGTVLFTEDPEKGGGTDGT